MTERAIARALDSIGPGVTRPTAAAQPFFVPGAFPRLAKHRLFAVMLNTVPPHAVYVAVADDGQAWLLPGEFDRMTAAEGLSVQHPPDALDLAWLYLATTRQGEIKILNSASDIPYIQKLWKDPQQFQGVVQPPETSINAGNYQLDVYTWSRVGGWLERYQLIVTPRGQVTLVQVQRMAGPVGDAEIVN